MPYQAKSHEENMTKVCIVCFGNSDRGLTTGLKEKFAQYLCPDYFTLSHFLPSGICATHRLLLGDFEKRNSSSEWPDYHKLAMEQRNLAPLTRSSLHCECRICQIARAKSKGTLIPKPKPGRPTSNYDSVQSTTVSICTKCQSQVGKGLSHDCNRTSRRQNIQRTLTPRLRAQITSQTLKSLATPNETTTSTSLGTQGRSLNVSFELGGKTSDSEPQKQVSHGAMRKMQASLNLSDRKTLQAAQVIRAEMGANAIEPNLRESLIERNRSLDNFFHHEKLLMTEKSKLEEGAIQRVPKDAVVCHDLNGLFQFIKKERGSNYNLLFKVGIDGGGGSLKVCWNAVQQPSSQSDTQSKEKTRGFLDSGVKRLIILAIVPGATESNENVGTILQAIKISSIAFCLCADLKLANICIGKQSHASKFPCTWCGATAPFEKEASLYTLGEIRGFVKDFRNAGMPMRRAQQFQNCVNMPLIQGSDSTLVLDLIPPPELHLMLGIVNRIFDSLNQQWGEGKAYEWGMNNGIIRVAYRGGNMEGNQCRKLLLKLNLLEKVLPKSLHSYLKALKDFDRVRLSCFGQTLQAGYEQSIDDFHKSYLDLKIPVTPKVHALIVHVKQFCKKNNVSLGPYSEQSSESVHADFKEIWKHNSVDISHPDFGKRLFSSVLKYNSLHVA